MKPGWQEGDTSFSGRITDVTAWREGWAGVIDSCVTEIGLSLEARVWIAVDADPDTLTFRVDADGRGAVVAAQPAPRARRAQ